MMQFIRGFGFLMAGLLTASTCMVAGNQDASATFQPLIAFDYPASPYGPVAQGLNGILYGTTNEPPGSIYQFDPATGNLSFPYSFCSLANCADGQQPVTGLVQAPNGLLYGATQIGGWTPRRGGSPGYGTIFSFSYSGVFTVLHTFNGLDGEAPIAGLALDSQGNVYGTTRSGGKACLVRGGCGTIFRMAADGTIVWLYSFTGVDGAQPESTLVLASDGNFYGTTSQGGANLAGTVFRITQSGQFTTVYNFCGQAGCTDGAHPAGGVIQATDGNLYGTAYAGGTMSQGTIFRLTLDGQLTTLVAFNTTDGARPTGSLVQGTDGNFYGTTFNGGDGGQSGGTVFQCTSAGVLTTLYPFHSLEDGELPSNGLFQDTNGNFYGTTLGGGIGGGTLYDVSLGLSPFVQSLPTLAPVGGSVILLGSGLTGALSVTFNGVPATFSVVSDTQITAAVPAGATTGAVQVTTPTGTLSSGLPFRVLPTPQ